MGGMKGAAILAAVLILICAVDCRPETKNDAEEYSYDDIQNDNTNNNYDYLEEDGDDNNGENTQQPLAPKIITKPKDYIAKPNSTVMITCEVENGESMVTMWKKNHVAIFQEGIKLNAIGDNYKVKNLPKNKTLTIENVGVNDMGNYTCSLPLNKTVSVEITHQLFVESAPKIKSLKAAHDVVQLDQGKTLILTCEATGHPKPTIKWSRKGIRLSEEGETVTIDNLSHVDAGDYQCLADNHIEPPAHDSIHIMVTHKPIVHIEKLSVNSETNLDVELVCIVHGIPKPDVLWKKNDVRVQKTDRYSYQNVNHTHVLAIKSVQKEDFGVYTCYAKNRIGKTEVNITLTDFPTTPVVQSNHHAHNKSIINWILESKAPITKYVLEFKKIHETNWQAKALEVSNGEGNIYNVHYTFENLEVGHKYEARLKAQNTYGWSEYSTPIEFVLAHDHHKAKVAHHANKEELSHQTLSPNKNEVLNSEIPRNPKGTTINDSYKGAPQESNEIVQKVHEEPRQAAKKGSTGSAAAILPVLSLIFVSLLTTILSH